MRSAKTPFNYHIRFLQPGATRQLVVGSARGTQMSSIIQRAVRTNCFSSEPTQGLLMDPGVTTEQYGCSSRVVGS